MIIHVIHYHQWQYKTPWLVRHKANTSDMPAFNWFLLSADSTSGFVLRYQTGEKIKNKSMLKGQPQTHHINGVMELYNKRISIMLNKSCYYTMRLVIIHHINYHRSHCIIAWLVKHNANSVHILVNANSGRSKGQRQRAKASAKARAEAEANANKE